MGSKVFRYFECCQGIFRMLRGLGRFYLYETALWLHAGSLAPHFTYRNCTLDRGLNTQHGVFVCKGRDELDALCPPPLFNQNYYSFVKN
jgi:hypothetical protein